MPIIDEKTLAEAIQNEPNQEKRLLLEKIVNIFANSDVFKGAEINNNFQALLNHTNLKELEKAIGVLNAAKQYLPGTNQIKFFSANYAQYTFNLLCNALSPVSLANAVLKLNRTDLSFDDHLPMVSKHPNPLELIDAYHNLEFFRPNLRSTIKDLDARLFVFAKPYALILALRLLIDEPSTEPFYHNLLNYPMMSIILNKIRNTRIIPNAQLLPLTAERLNEINELANILIFDDVSTAFWENLPETELTKPWFDNLLNFAKTLEGDLANKREMMLRRYAEINNGRKMASELNALQKEAELKYKKLVSEEESASLNLLQQEKDAREITSNLTKIIKLLKGENACFNDLNEKIIRGLKSLGPNLSPIVESITILARTSLLKTSDAPAIIENLINRRKDLDIIHLNNSFKELVELSLPFNALKELFYALTQHPNPCELIDAIKIIQQDIMPNLQFASQTQKEEAAQALFRAALNNESFEVKPPVQGFYFSARPAPIRDIFMLRQTLSLLKEAAIALPNYTQYIPLIKQNAHPALSKMHRSSLLNAENFAKYLLCAEKLTWPEFSFRNIPDNWLTQERLDSLFNIAELASKEECFLINFP